MATTIYRKPRTTKYYLQWKGSWAKKPFSTKTVEEVGCGLVAYTNMALEIPKYEDITPNKFRKYMNQFTEPDHGVLGIHLPEAFEHLGLTKVKDFKGDIVGGKMRPFYDEMEKGNRIGMILFQNPLRDEGKIQTAPDGTIWCTRGHYVTVKGLKKVGKLYYLYVVDPDDEEHIGWFSYIKSMKHCVKWLWTGKINS